MGENQTDGQVEGEEREDDSKDGRGDSKTILFTSSSRETTSINSVEDPGKSLEEESDELDEPELRRTMSKRSYGQFISLYTVRVIRGRERESKRPKGAVGGIGAIENGKRCYVR